MDRIFIEHLALRGKHGVSGEERSHEQEFVLDVTVDFDTAVAAKSDELSDTIDYNHFRDAARAVVAGPSFKLLERLADAVAQRILDEQRIAAVSVTVRKTEMFPDCTPGVTVKRQRV